MQPNTNRIHKHLQVLCEDIGCRYSGSKGERAAADYIEGQFRGLGLAKVRQEPFSFPNWRYGSAELKVGRREPTRGVPCMPIVYSPNTPRRGIDGEIVYLETATEIDMAKHELDGKFGVLFGGYGDDPSKLLRIQTSGLAAMIVVDWRIPFDWQLALGLPTRWHKYALIPSVSIPYMHLDRILKADEKRARLIIKGGKTFEDKSSNVVAEVKGSRWPNEIITICGHYDSVAAGVGANDDGSGTVFTIELAALFAKANPGRTLRFCTFGVEEKLSAGSAHHVTLKRNRVERNVLCINADSIAGLMGENVIHVTGDRRVRRLAARHARGAQYAATVTSAISPYSDHFPFNMHGVPSLWFYRRNTPGGNWFFHSRHDNPSNISLDALAGAIRAAAGVLGEVANAPQLPYSPRIPSGQAKQIRTLARDLYEVEGTI